MGRMVKGKLEKLDPKKIAEDIKYSRYDLPSHTHPTKGETNPNPQKPVAYSWLKAPRYDGQVYEVGPLARVKITYASQTYPKLNQLLDETLNTLQVGPEALCSVMGRHLARAIECKIIADAMSDMILQVKLDQPVCTDHQIPKSAEGMGLWGAQATFGLMGADCTEYASLVAALSRAQGIPARYYEGLLYLEERTGGIDEQIAQTEHAWLDVYLPGIGWTALDPTMGREQVNRDTYFAHYTPDHIIVTTGRNPSTLRGASYWTHLYWPGNLTNISVSEASWDIQPQK